MLSAGLRLVSCTQRVGLPAPASRSCVYRPTSSQYAVLTYEPCVFDNCTRGISNVLFQLVHSVLTLCPLQIRSPAPALFALRPNDPYLDRLGTTNAVSPNFKFYFFSFSKGTIVHPFKLLAVEEHHQHYQITLSILTENTTIFTPNEFISTKAISATFLKPFLTKGSTTAARKVSYCFKKLKFG